MVGEVDNLDKLAAKHAQNLIRKTVQDGDIRDKARSVDNLVTNALGVLQENGVYASMLYLLSRTRPEEVRVATTVEGEMLNLLENLDFAKLEERNDSEKVLNHLSENVTGGSLERLFLAKETMEMMLIYARYGAKARIADTTR